VEFPFWQQHLRDQQLERQYNYLLEASNCSNIYCLRSLSEDALAIATQATYVKAYADGAYGYGNFYYGPYVDGAVIQDLPSREFDAGHFTKVPLLVDHDGYEGVSFSNQSLKTLQEERTDLNTQFPYANDAFVQEIFELYASADFNASFWQRQQWFGDFSINCPTYYIASTLTSLNIPTYKMIFNAGMQTHAATGPFLADPSSLPPGFPNPGYNATLAAMMKDWWISFALHLDPNAQSWSDAHKPKWPIYGVDSQIMSINYTESGNVSDLSFDKTDRCQFMWVNQEIVQN
jgi:carboxylesterase type B